MSVWSFNPVGGLRLGLDFCHFEEGFGILGDGFEITVEKKGSKRRGISFSLTPRRSQQFPKFQHISENSVFVHLSHIINPDHSGLNSRISSLRDDSVASTTL